MHAQYSPYSHSITVLPQLQTHTVIMLASVLYSSHVNDTIFTSFQERGANQMKNILLHQFTPAYTTWPLNTGLSQVFVRNLLQYITYMYPLVHILFCLPFPSRQSMSSMGG